MSRLMQLRVAVGRKLGARPRVIGGVHAYPSLPGEFHEMIPSAAEVQLHREDHQEYVHLFDVLLGVLVVAECVDQPRSGVLDNWIGVVVALRDACDTCSVDPCHGCPPPSSSLQLHHSIMSSCCQPENEKIASRLAGTKQKFSLRGPGWGLCGVPEGPAT